MLFPIAFIERLLIMHPELKSLIDTHQYIVFFGGAGVSTESGIPDFRSEDGLYNKKGFPYPPETMLSRSFFDAHTTDFFNFYRQVMLAPNQGANRIHKKLYELEQDGKLKAIITQNIDGLHQEAGSQAVFELHGSIKRNYCMSCNGFYDESFILSATGVPKCPKDGAVIKPNVVLYEEELNTMVVQSAISHIKQADMIIVAGTSLAVYPAASLLDYFKGDSLVLINNEPTPRDKKASLLIHDLLGNVLCD